MPWGLDRWELGQGGLIGQDPRGPLLCPVPLPVWGCGLCSIPPTRALQTGVATTAFTGKETEAGGSDLPNAPQPERGSPRLGVCVLSSPFGCPKVANVPPMSFLMRWPRCPRPPGSLLGWLKCCPLPPALHPGAAAGLLRVLPHLCSRTEAPSTLFWCFHKARSACSSCSINAWN